MNFSQIMVLDLKNILNLKCNFKTFSHNLSEIVKLKDFVCLIYPKIDFKKIILG